MAYQVDKKGKKIRFIFPKEKNVTLEEITAPSKYFGTPLNEGTELGEVIVTFSNMKNDKDILGKHFRDKKIKLTKCSEKMLLDDIEHVKKNVDLK